MGAYARTYNLTNGTVAYGDQVVFELDAIASSVNNIVNAQISSGAAISDSKLAQISTGSKVALSGLVQGGTGEVLLSGSGTADWGPIDNAYAMAGSVVQTVNYQTGAYASGVTAMPVDDSIPQNTEGDEYMTLAITPKSATNKLKILINILGTPSPASNLTVALFQDSTANALAVSTATHTSGWQMSVSLTHFMDAGTTSATTFKVRCGVGTGTFMLNGSGSRVFGGVASSSITIQEVKI